MLFLGLKEILHSIHVCYRAQRQNLWCVHHYLGPDLRSRWQLHNIYYDRVLTIQSKINANNQLKITHTLTKITIYSTQLYHTADLVVQAMQ